MQSWTGRTLCALPALAPSRRLQQFKVLEKNLADELRTLTIPEAFGRSADQHKLKEACVFHDGTRKTFEQFHSDVARFSSGLQQLALDRHSRIAIFAPTCYEWLIAKYAINRAGCIVVAINSEAHEGELRYILEKTESKAIILGRPFKYMDYRAKLRSAFPNFGGPLKHIIEMDGEKRAGTLRMSEMLETPISQGVSVAAKDPAAIIQSSGSTGRPKSIVLTHQNIVSASYYNFSKMRLHKSNIVLASLPLYHSFGYVCIESNDTLNGLTTVYTSMKPKPEESLQMVADENVSTIHGTPTTFHDILRCSKFSQSDVSSLENGTIGATTLHPSKVAEIITKLGLKDFMQGYGLTETSGACAFGDGKNFDGYELFPGTKVRIVKDDDRAMESGERGEIQLKGPTLFEDYLNDPEKTKAVMTNDGWFRTGDLGVLTDRGKLIVDGRLSDMIIKGGVNVSPAEVEQVLLQHPSVLEAHVVGVSDDRLGEEICAWIKLRQGQEFIKRELKDFADEKLSRIKVPKYVVVTDEFPKTSVGKVSKLKLRETFAKMETTKKTSFSL